MIGLATTSAEMQKDRRFDSLGCLLSEKLAIRLHRVGSGKRRTFADGEQRLSEWMATNALVAWMRADNPWNVEEELIASLSLPLNLHDNSPHPFHAELSATRKGFKQRADTFPVWPSIT